MAIDVSTGGELHVALAAGVPAASLVLHGNNKSDDELTRALEVGVGRIVVDSFDELDRLDRLVPDLGVAPPAVLLRVTPGIEAHTHEYVRTGQDDSKFGFTLSTGLAAQAVERATASPHVELVGIHVHIGSQVFVADFFRAAVEAIATFFEPVGARRAVDRWRYRGGLRRGGRSTDHHRLGRRGAHRGSRRRASPHGSPRSRVGPSRLRPGSPSTRSARSRSCPDYGPTWPSTAACPTTPGR